MGEHVGYLELLRRNSEFRRLFAANWISFLGDWFSIIALFILSADQSDNSPLAIAAVLIFRMLGLALIEPFTGLLADRFSRRKLMLLSNFLSLIILLGFVQFKLLDSLMMVYVMAFSMMFCRAIYDPAVYAYIPNITTKDELLTANALGSLGWSAALGFGAALGGFTIAAYGVNTSLLIDAVTFVVAYLLIWTLPEGGPSLEKKRGGGVREVLGGVTEGWQIILNRPEIHRIIVAKGLWAVGGGAQIFLLILIGAEGGFGAVAAGIGVLYMARGFGSGVGPVLARWLWPDRRSWPFLIGGLVSLSGVFYIVVGLIEWTWWIIPCIFVSHAASGANWVFSTTLIQERADDEWRGRAAGTDYLLMSVTSGTSSLMAALILEYGVLDLRQTLILTASLQVVAGILWLILGMPAERRWAEDNAQLAAD
tara:strand:+ start:3004 stop:4275 length:1272 start_codon:yes stop_codon:yes gene_type:complete